MPNLWLFYMQRPALICPVPDFLGGNLRCSDAVISRQITTSGRTGLEHADTDDPLFSQISFWQDNRGWLWWGGVLFFLLLVLVWGQASVACTHLCSVKMVVSGAGLYPNRLRKSPWACWIQFLCSWVQLSWYYLVLVSISILFLRISE